MKKYFRDIKKETAHTSLGGIQNISEVTCNVERVADNHVILDEAILKKM